jgi:hypothetical protein
VRIDLLAGVLTDGGALISVKKEGVYHHGEEVKELSSVQFRIE